MADDPQNLTPDPSVDTPTEINSELVTAQGHVSRALEVARNAANAGMALPYEVLNLIEAAADELKNEVHRLRHAKGFADTGRAPDPSISGSARPTTETEPTTEGTK